VIRQVNALVDTPPPVTSLADSYATTTTMAVAITLVGVAFHLHHALLS